MILNSGEKVTRFEVRGDSLANFTGDVCDALLWAGWTELSRQSAWQELILSYNPVDGSYCGPDKDTIFTWKTSPSGPYEVAIGANVGESTANLGAAMLAAGAISHYATKYEMYAPHGVMSGFIRMWKDPGEDFALAFKPAFMQEISGTTNTNSHKHKFYRTTSTWQYSEEPWMWGYRRFLSKATPQGHQVILYVGWQTDSSKNIWPCFHMVDAYSDAFDPKPIAKPGDIVTAPIWNSCMGYYTTRTYEVICNPYQFIVYSPQFSDSRSFVMGSVIRMAEANEVHQVETVEDIGYYTRIQTQEPHNLEVGDIITLRGVTSSNGGPNISDTPYSVMNVIDANNIHINVDTRGYTYSSGIMGDNLHPFNAFFLFSPESSVGFPRTTNFCSNLSSALYYWHNSGWSTGTTGTAGTYNNSNTGLRVPVRTQRSWPGGRGTIFPPLVGWGDSFTDSNNYWRGFLWDSFLTNRSHPMDRYEEVREGENWYQLVPGSQTFSFWMRTT